MRKTEFEEFPLVGKNFLKAKMIKLFPAPQESDVISIRKKRNIFYVPFYWYPGAGNGYPLQYPFLENSMDRGAWRATVHGAAESDTAVQLTLSLSTYDAEGGIKSKQLKE